MPDFDGTVDLVKRYLHARLPLILIRTIEPRRARDVVGTCAAELRQMTHYEHSRTEGFRDLSTSAVVEDEASLAGAMDIAGRAFKSRSNVNVLFHDVDDVSDDSATSRHVAELVRLAQSRSGTVILMTDGPVWTGLARLGMTVVLDVPSADEISRVVGQMVDDHRNVIDVQWGPAEIGRAAEILAGVTEDEAVNAVATLLARGRVAAGDLAELSEVKDQIFGDLSGIERVPLDDDYRVGGLTSLRSWLAVRSKLMKADLRHSRLPPPRGVLLVGISGCGKSLSAKAVAQDWSFPLYRLDMSAVLGMYVGQSEGRLREALDMADRLAPCVLWIDEIEKALAGGGGDGGTTRRLIGQFLFWLQESRAKVFVIATANDVSMLPAELLRKGRFDEMFFVDLPDESDRNEIISLSWSRYLDADCPVPQDELVALSTGFTGSDIDAVVREVATHQFSHDEHGSPTPELVRRCFTNVVPFSRTNSEEVAAVRAWGHERCVPAGATTVPNESSAAPARRVVVL